MDTLHESTLDEFARHAKYCQTGSRRCLDCRLAADPRLITRVAIARSEFERIRDWLRDFDHLCVYCAAFAEHADHLVPKPWTGPVVRQMVPTVPACADCNVRIGAALVHTIAGRAGIVATSIRKKWRDKLDIPDRTQAELDEFTGRLRQRVELTQLQRQEIRRRLMVLDLGGAPASPDVAWITS